MTDRGDDHPLTEARAAYARRDWARAYEQFHAARTTADLSAPDLSALANAAWWLGHTDECLDISEEVYRHHLHGDHVPAAAELALTIGILSVLRGNVTVGSGWISRARRLLREQAPSRAHGILLSLDAEEALTTGDVDGALVAARQAQQIGQRLGEADLTALGLVSEGVTLIRTGQVGQGMATIDEAMLPVRAGQVTPDWTGNLYCQVMQVCHELADLNRARQWTEITERWCAGFPSAVMFTGICRIHRAQLRHLEGDWTHAEQEARRVCDELATMNVAVVAEAHYQLGEIRRLRADLPGAEQAYRQAHDYGRDPQPGLALLRLAQGRTEVAASSIQAAVAATDDPLTRARLRAAQVDIAHHAGDPATATAAADDLDLIARDYATAGLAAMAAQARGTAWLTASTPAKALPALRDACRRWHDLGAPYPAARARLRIAEACAALDDADGTARELDAATSVFAPLGAVADLTTATRLRDKGETLPGRLTAREAEVLSLVAAGRSNRQIAAALVVSEKTVARHLSNIFTKIEVRSRTEAAAFAFTHGLATRG